MIIDKKPPLGAALYVPATHPDLAAIMQGDKLPHIKELIICTEDSVAEHELPHAIANLKAALDSFVPSAESTRHLFLRPRHPAILHELLQHPKALKTFSGVALPKFTENNLPLWRPELPRTTANGHPFWLMPILETVDVFSPSQMEKLAHALQPLAKQILTLRIGGNDLLALLNIRRPRGCTLYETALGHTIAQLSTCFIPKGFALSAAVFEYLDDPETLAREVQSDLHYGLTGKTAIHPEQIALIEQHYAVSEADLRAAQAILNPEASGVFRLDGAMCEPATHRAWAEKMRRHARFFGVRTN
ncbi:HpcH/HpaI aldolase/citrate lyase family protein [Suttonella ornithocola]|nr:HpcH/HpaI aldolase/citrate lyase family protein [Suttonella ornithocola]